MNTERFNSLVNQVQDECRDILCKRGEVYAEAEGDRFRNFKNVARIFHNTKYQALQGMFAKHLEAWMNFCEKPVTDTSYDQWKEKIIDMMNYLTICLGMVTEDFEEEEQHYAPDSNGGQYATPCYPESGQVTWIDQPSLSNVDEAIFVPSCGSAQGIGPIGTLQGESNGEHY